MTDLSRTAVSAEADGMVRTAAVSPFAGSSIDFLQHCQQVLTEEESFKGVLKRFVSILSDYFGLTHATYFLTEVVVAHEEPKRNSVRFPPLKVLEEELLQKIRPVIAGMLLSEEDIRTGINTIRVANTDYFFAVVIDPCGGDGILLWRQPPLSVRSPLLRQLSDQPASLTPLLDFVTRTAQQTCRWLKRLDSTQAMLYQDEVTGLYNYRYLDVALNSELRRLQRFHSPFSLLFIDLDNFKGVNDVHGHLTGSSVLRQVGDVIKLAVRDVDNVIRYGGDEFVVVLIGANSRQALQAAERVRSRVQGTVFKSEDRQPVNLTVSIGIASCPEHGREKTAILKMADETMYASKRGGKNRVMIVNGSPGAAVNEASEKVIR